MLSGVQWPVDGFDRLYLNTSCRQFKAECPSRPGLGSMCFVLLGAAGISRILPPIGGFPMGRLTWDFGMKLWQLYT